MLPSVKETLKRSSKLIQERGLCKNKAIKPDGSICTTTAIQIAIGLRNNTGDWSSSSGIKERSCENEVFKHLGTFIIDKELVEDIQFDNDKTHKKIIQFWNDTKERTLLHVVNTLQLAATESEM